MKKMNLKRWAGMTLQGTNGHVNDFGICPEENEKPFKGFRRHVTWSDLCFGKMMLILVWGY